MQRHTLHNKLLVYKLPLMRADYKLESAVLLSLSLSYMLLAPTMIDKKSSTTSAYIYSIECMCRIHLQHLFELRLFPTQTNLKTVHECYLLCCCYRICEIRLYLPLDAFLSISRLFH